MARHAAAASPNRAERPGAARRAGAAALALALWIVLGVGAAMAAAQSVEVGAAEIGTELETATDVGFGGLLALRPCLHVPGCEVASASSSTEPAAEAEPDAPAPSIVPLPAALGLLGAAMAALAVLLHRGRAAGRLPDA